MNDTRCNNCKNDDVSVINTLCNTCFPKENKAMFEALMSSSIETMKPIRNYIDNNGIFHEAGTRENQIREHHREEGHNI